jgi:hypothetical protein
MRLRVMTVLLFPRDENHAGHDARRFSLAGIPHFACRSAKNGRRIARLVPIPAWDPILVNQLGAESIGRIVPTTTAVTRWAQPSLPIASIPAFWVKSFPGGSRTF